MSVHLPTLCEHLYKQELYKWNEFPFRLQIVTGGFEPGAKFTMDRRSLTLKVCDLKYLLLDMSTFVRQLARYTMSDTNSEYVHSSTALSSFVAPYETAFLFVQYDMLFDEITGKF